MKELLRTNDVTLLAYADAVLKGEGITAIVLDMNASIIEGSLGILARRMMVRDEDFDRARELIDLVREELEKSPPAGLPLDDDDD